MSLQQFGSNPFRHLLGFSALDRSQHTLVVLQRYAFIKPYVSTQNMKIRANSIPQKVNYLLQYFHIGVSVDGVVELFIQPQVLVYLIIFNGFFALCV